MDSHGGADGLKGNKNMLLKAGEIGAIGERHATEWLKSQGCRCRTNTQQPGSTDIEAVSTTKKLLVQVKTAIAPSAAPTLSGDEKRDISSRATRIGYEAWSARVQINGRGEQVGDIIWQKLT
jgi:hypothetical protein